jgi:hypothetical protein
MAVFVNNVEISAAEQERIFQQHGLRFPAGRFWYDRMSGAWGCDGTPAFGLTRAGLEIGGSLPEDATVKAGGMLGFLMHSRIFSLVAGAAAVRAISARRRAGTSAATGRRRISSIREAGRA